MSPEQTTVPPVIEELKKPAISELDSAEMRIMHGLVKDLEDLSKNGVESLQIERADSFLASLVDAVNRIKTK